MKYFLSYKHTGTNEKTLHDLQYAIKEVFDESKDIFYSTYFNQDAFKHNNMSDAEILKHALRKIDDYDCLLVIVDSSDKSEGMLIEIGYGIAINKPIIIALQKDVKGLYFPAIADKLMEYSDFNDLKIKLRNVL